MKGVGKLTVETIKWVGLTYRIWWSTQNGWNIAKGGQVDLVHPAHGYESIPCLTFQKLLVQHIQTRFRLNCALDIFDWDEGLLQKI